MAPTFLTTSEVAARLGVHRDTVRRWVHEGTLTSSATAGRTLLFDREVVEAKARELVAEADARAAALRAAPS